MFCSNCGQQISDGVKFCPNCGSKIENFQTRTNNPTPQFVPAKCTNCGGVLEVNPSQEAAICPYCGTPYVVEKAIQNYKITNIHIGTQINVQGADPDNLISLAESDLRAGKYKDAEHYADRALESESSNIEAWNIKILTAGYDIEGDRSSEIASYIETALANGADDSGEIKLYETVLKIALLHIEKATELLSDGMGGIERQLKNKRNKRDIAAMDSGYIAKTTRIINEAIEYRNLVPKRVFSQNKSMQNDICSLGKAYEKYCDALENRYASYKASVPHKIIELQEENREKIMYGIPFDNNYEERPTDTIQSSAAKTNRTYSKGLFKKLLGRTK